MRLSVLCAALALAACEPAEGPSAAAEPAQGWAFGALDDVGALLDCVEAQGASLVAAHRGGPAPGYPENSLETLKYTLASAPALMEVDIAASADGVLFLMHDEDLDRTTTGTGPVSALAWEQIERLRLKDAEGRVTAFSPPRFDEVLAWAEGRTILELDFKPSASYEAAAKEIRRQQAEDRVILIAYSLSQARRLHALLPETMISLSIRSQSELNRAVAAGVPADRLVAFTGVRQPDARLYDILEARDVEVISGALGGRDSIDADVARSGDDAQYANLSRLGADIIATDRPLAAQAALEAAGRALAPGECGLQRTQ